jgi:cytochrome c5
MMMKGIILFFTLALLLVTLGCTKNEQTPFKTHAPPVVTSAHETSSLHTKNSTKIKEFFEVKCSLCHPLSRSTSKRKKYDDWLMTVYHMKNLYGVLITDEEVEVIGRYLNETYGK